MSVFGFGEVVVEGRAVVVVVTGQVYSGHGHPFGQPDWHGHWFKLSFNSSVQKFLFLFQYETLNVIDFLQ